MPRQEFIDLVSEIKKTGKSRKMTKRDFIWLFDWCEKRTSGNVWRINEFLQKEKLVVEPNYQNGWIDEEITLKEKDKARIKTPTDVNSDEGFDPITRLSILEAASKTPISITKESNLEKAYHLMWQNHISQLPVMNNDREVLGVISWKSIAKGMIAKKESVCVKDYMTNEYKILKEDTPLFDAIKEVMQSKIVFVLNKENKIKGPVTTADLNIQFIELIEPYILLEQIENYIRMILHNKLILEEVLELIKTDDCKKIASISDLTFGGYLVLFSNDGMWKQLNLPFDKAYFVNDLDKIRKIRNDVMHFSPDKTSKEDLNILRNTSSFLMDYLKNSK
nr:CBS domain-containing protein [uncultured Bacteroides sp.]